MKISTRAALSLVLIASAFGCRGTAPTDTGLKDQSGTPDTGADGAGGILTIMAIPPAGALDWTTPTTLTKTSVASKVKGELNKQLGRVVLPHPIGHLHVKMSCDGVEIPLTGQTGGGSEYATLLDGVGASLRIFPGMLDKPEGVQPDVDARFKSGKIAGMNFKISGKMCKHLKGYLDEYVKRGAHNFYGGQFRPRRWEGAGCSAFGVSFIEVGGLLRRSLYTKTFARSLFIGLGRITDFAGSGEYKYGSNLTAYDGNGAFVQWPKGVNVKVLNEPIKPGSPWLKAWTDDKDASANVAPNEQPNQIPWTIYDPELMFNWIQSFHAAGGGDAFGRKWTTSTKGAARFVETDATDAVPQPWEDAQDDLNLD